MEVFGTIDDIQPNKHFVTIWIVTDQYEGELKIMEPEKQDEWKWFDLDHLPDQIYSPSQKFINSYLKKRTDSQFVLTYYNNKCHSIFTFFSINCSIHFLHQFTTNI